jgi:hypothetical protein
MSGLTGYLLQDGTDLSYVFHPKNSTPATNQNIIYTGQKNNFAGITTFSNLQLSCGTINNTTTTLSRPILNFYHVTSGATTITLPSVVDADRGTFIIFKHTVRANITIQHNTSALVGIQSVGSNTFSTVTNASVIMITCNGTAWWIYNTSEIP